MLIREVTKNMILLGQNFVELSIFFYFFYQ
jgi:hypothetical protein